MIYIDTTLAVLLLGIGIIGAFANLFLVEPDEFTKPRPPRRPWEPGVGVVLGAVSAWCAVALLYRLWGTP